MYNEFLVIYIGSFDTPSSYTMGSEMPCIF